MDAFTSKHATRTPPLVSPQISPPFSLRGPRLVRCKKHPSLLLGRGRTGSGHSCVRYYAVRVKSLSTRSRYHSLPDHRRVHRFCCLSGFTVSISPLGELHALTQVVTPKEPSHFRERTSVVKVHYHDHREPAHPHPVSASMRYETTNSSASAKTTPPDTCDTKRQALQPQVRPHHLVHWEVVVSAGIPLPVWRLFAGLHGFDVSPVVVARQDNRATGRGGQLVQELEGRAGLLDQALWFMGVSASNGRSG